MSSSCLSEKCNSVRVGIKNVLVPTFDKMSQNDYEGANFTLANGNRNVHFETLMSIDMLIIQFS